MDRKDEGFRRYKVSVCLEGDYIIIAKDKEDAFIQASNFAMSGGSWSCEIEEIDDSEDKKEWWL